jgi:ATP-dependent protease ClpP protease subunit
MNETYVHTIIFDETITNETVAVLIDEMANWQYINLYFSSPGGEIPFMHVLADYINSRKDKIDVFPTFQNCSAAAILVFKHLECKIVIREELLDYIMFHKIGRQIVSQRKNKSYDNMEVIDAKTNKLLSKFLNRYIPKKKVKEFKKGKDVEFCYTDIKKYFKKPNIFYKDAKK